MNKMMTKVPAQKVTAATAGAAAGTLVAAIINRYVEVPLDVIEVGGIITIFTFLSGYVTPPNDRDQVVSTPSDKQS